MLDKDLNEIQAKEETRTKTEMQVYYVVSDQRILSSFTVDLTTGGLYLKTNYPFNVNDTLSLLFALPESDKAIKCHAKVSWLNNNKTRKKLELPPGVGVQFLDVHPEDLKLIQKHLN